MPSEINHRWTDTTWSYLREESKIVWKQSAESGPWEGKRNEGISQRYDVPAMQDD